MVHYMTVPQLIGERPDAEPQAKSLVRGKGHDPGSQPWLVAGRLQPMLASTVQLVQALSSPAGQKRNTARVKQSWDMLEYLIKLYN